MMIKHVFFRHHYNAVILRAVAYVDTFVGRVHQIPCLLKFRNWNLSHVIDGRITAVLLVYFELGWDRPDDIGGRP